MHDLKAVKEKLSSCKVLIVDDEEDIRNVITQTFESFFSEVVCAVDGQDALEKFTQEGPFDMILTDISMPNLTGIELVTEIRLIDKEVFIVIMSGAFDDYQQEFPKDEQHINKPFTFAETIGLLVKLIEHKNID